MKIYEVIIQDIWNNLEMVGYYKDLNDAIPDINNHIFEDQYKIQPGDLEEYPGTFGPVFDTCVGDIINNRIEVSDEDYDHEDMQLMIRGFILDSEEIRKNLEFLEGENHGTNK